MANKKDIDIEHFKKWLKYDADTGIFTWKKRPANCVRIGDIAGCVTVYGYVSIRVKGVDAYLHRVAWLWHNEEIDEIDHINGIRSDNRLINLRDVNRTLNNRNKHVSHSNTGVIGIYKRDRKKKYQVIVGGLYVGSYAKLKDAVIARDNCMDEAGGYHINHREVGVLSQS